jgi:hypothetical protein
VPRQPSFLLKIKITIMDISLSDRRRGCANPVHWSERERDKERKREGKKKRERGRENENEKEGERG